MKRFVLLAGMHAALLGSQAFAQAGADCISPAEVQIPAGATASLDDMLAAQSAVRDFMSDMDAFLECINSAIEAQGEETPAEVSQALVARHNQAVDSMELLASRFNEERIAYQEANASD